MQTFFKWFTIITIVVGLITCALWVQEKHLTGGGSTSGSYTPTKTVDRDEQDFGIFRTDNTKPNVEKLTWETATSKNGKKWCLTIDGKDKKQFDSLDEANKELEQYGLEWKPLTKFQSFMKKITDLF